MLLEDELAGLLAKKKELQQASLGAVRYCQISQIMAFLRRQWSWTGSKTKWPSNAKGECSRRGQRNFSSCLPCCFLGEAAKKLSEADLKLLLAAKEKEAKEKKEEDEKKEEEEEEEEEEKAEG